MKTAYTEYRVVVVDGHIVLPATDPSTDEAAAQRSAGYLRDQGLSAFVDARDVSEWRRENPS